MTRTEAIYELHITADNSNADQAALFMQECKQAGVKAFFVDNGINKVSTHLMTSVICKGGDALAQAQKTIQFASARSGAQITRTKVEVPPGPGFDYVVGSMYYEVHVEVKGEYACDIPFDHHLWSCSARPDKPGFFLLTMRAYNTTLAQFKACFENSLTEFSEYILDNHIQVEKCISDDNTKLDADWMVTY